LEQITLTTPQRFTTWQYSQRRFTEALTFISTTPKLNIQVTSSSNCLSGPRLFSERWNGRIAIL